MTLSYSFLHTSQRAISSSRAATSRRSTRCRGCKVVAGDGLVARVAPRDSARDWVARIFTRVEDLVYIGRGVLRAGPAIVPLAVGAYDFVSQLVAGGLPGHVVELLDRILLILMIVEILYTVQVSFREHALVPEPFLIVGLIAAVRRILVTTAEFARVIEQGGELFRNAMIELAVLTVMVLALVASLLMLRRRGSSVTAERG